ncbi:MAG: rhodanese-like domain-containing protein [Epsilonproteobacteria bacterium]|nr:MAG: rhodanese-like domain-containing protein [Campylobacterota bacterium]
MKKSLFILVGLTAAAVSNNIMSLQYKGVKSQHDDGYDSIRKITIEREVDALCLSISISSPMVWEGNYASREVPQRCKATFVKTLGQIQPLKIGKDIDTFGELEVLDFIEKMNNSKDMLLVDTRHEEWYEYRTIPSAINIPFSYITKSKQFPEEFKEVLKTFGVKTKKNSYDFSNCKTIALFCNGAWCSQSPSMIKSLLMLGYPAHKIKWYRGGMHDWLSMSMTTTRP